MRSSAVRVNFTSSRRPLGSSSSVLKVPNEFSVESLQCSLVSKKIFRCQFDN